MLKIQYKYIIVILSIVLMVAIVYPQEVTGMANKYCNLDGTKKIKNEFNKITEGFGKVEEDLKDIIVTPAEGVSEQEIIQARKGKSTLGSKIGDIDNNIGIIGNNLEAVSTTLNNKIEDKDFAINNRVDSIIATPTTVSEQEIIDARQDKASLGANLTGIKNDLLKNKSDFTRLEEKLNPIINYNIPVRTPVGFNWEDHPLKDKIFTDGKGNFSADFDVSESKNIGGKTYYIALDGLDTNDGLTPDTPKRWLYSVKDLQDCTTIMVKGGDYYRRSSNGGAPIGPISKDLNIIGYDGVVRMIMADDKLYTKTSGHSNVYQISRSAVGRVIDLNHKGKDGEYLELNELLTTLEVDSTPNSYCIISNIVYVHAIDSRVIDDLSICALIQVESSDITKDNVKAYYENLEIIGGSRSIRNDYNNSKIYAKNCKFSYSAHPSGNLLGLEGGLAILQNCIATKAAMDGFNYHAHTDGTAAKFIEIDCESYENGGENTGSASNNGSTAHGGCIGIRINGKYYRNNGGNVADVNSDTQTWNLGCIAFESKQGSDFLITNNGGEMWLDECVAFGSTNSLNIADSNSKAYIRNGQYQIENIVGTKGHY